MSARDLAAHLKARADLNSDGKLDKEDVEAALKWVEEVAVEHTVKAPLSSLAAAFASGAILMAVLMMTFR